MQASTAKGIQSVACGQLVSLFSIASLIMAKYLALRDVSTPAFLNCCFYVALSIVCLAFSFWQQRKLPSQQPSAAQPVTPIGSPVLTPNEFHAVGGDLEAAMAKRSQGQQQTLSEPRWWSYPLVAFFDLQANCLAIRSLAFTDYITAGLMLNLTIPFVLLLSYAAFSHKYSCRHVAGCATAAVGGLVLFIGSGWRDRDNENSQHLFGCFVALTAALMYGASNIANQLFLKTQSVDRAVESLGMIGGWGAALAMLQMIFLERTQVSAIVWTDELTICFAAHVLAMLSFYLLVAMLPRPTTASPLYSLSILVSNLYLPFASRYLFGEYLRVYFVAALVLVLIGLSIHCVEHSLAAKQKQQHQHQHQEQSKDLHVSFSSLQTPTTDLEPVAIQIEQAAL